MFIFSGMPSYSDVLRGGVQETFEQDFEHFIPLLSNEKEVILFPIFPSHSPYKQQCVRQGRCREAFFLFYMNHSIAGSHFLRQNMNY